jgi:alcohol dehydrogenase class IV
MSLAFEFATATRIIFGAGRVREIGSLAKSLGTHALVVAGRNATRTQPVITALGVEGMSASVFATAGEPEVDTVIQGVAQAKETGCDLVISYGGGSVIDSGKAIATMLTNNGPLLDFLEVIGRGKALEKPGVPFIAIPTTAGTGSEVTRNSVLASPKDRVKVSLRSPFMLPRIALIDPETTYGLPGGITASTGLDALTQLIEPYVCNRPNPISDAICLEGIRRAARALPAVCANGNDIGARSDMAVASLFGGLALANAGLGAVHGFAGPIGGMFPAPHGAICAALLPHVMEINLRALRKRQPASEIITRYETVARLLTGNSSASADDGSEWVLQLLQTIKIPRLEAYGINSQSIPEIVDKSAKASSMKANPIVLTREEMSEMISRAM